MMSALSTSSHNDVSSFHGGDHEATSTSRHDDDVKGQQAIHGAVQSEAEVLGIIIKGGGGTSPKPGPISSSSRPSRSGRAPGSVDAERFLGNNSSRGESSRGSSVRLDEHPFSTVGANDHGGSHILDDEHGPDHEDDDVERALQVSPYAYTSGGDGAQVQDGRRRPRSCLISLRVGVFLVVAVVIGTAGFTHLATLLPNSKPIEEQGILTYRTTLNGAGNTLATKIVNELSMLVQLAGLAYISPRVGYNITQRPDDNPTWDIGMHKWFLGEALMHPERRFCYIDAGSWSWTCQHLRDSLDVRVVGNQTSYFGEQYVRNTVGNALPLRYDHNSTLPLAVNPTEIAIQFLIGTTDVVFFMSPFLDFTGGISYAFAIRNVNASAQLQGVIMLYVPIEDFITPTSLVYARQYDSCEQGPCSATFDGTGALVTTTVPAITSVYVDPSVPGAICETSAVTGFTRCRHSRQTLSRVWPQLPAVLAQRPDVLTTEWLSFQFKYEGEHYLSTSGLANISFQSWLTVVITPADPIFGAFYTSRNKIIIVVVAASVASCVIALLFIQLALSRITTTLDDMTSALALRSRTQSKGELMNRREGRSTHLIGLSEIQAIDDAIIALDSYLDSLGALLPSAVLASMRRQVAKLRRDQRKSNRLKWGPLAFLFSSSIVADDSNSEASERESQSDKPDPNSSAQVPDDASLNNSFDDETILIAGLRIGTLSNTMGKLASDTTASPPMQTLSSGARHSSGSGVTPHSMLPPLQQLQAAQQRQGQDQVRDRDREADHSVDSTVLVVETHIHHVVAETHVEPRNSLPMDLEFATEPELSFGDTVGPNAVDLCVTDRPNGILQPSKFQSVVFRRKGIFASVSLGAVECDSADDFQQLLSNIMRLNWSYKGEFEGFSFKHFLFSFGCYEDIKDPEVCACSCALNMLRGFQQWCIASEGRIRGKISVAIDAGRYEDVTLVACANTPRPIRSKIITTAARYSVERLNVLCDILNEPLVVTEEVKKNLKLVTSVIDNVRFAPTCMPRLSRRGDVRLYRVEMKSASAPTPPVTLQFLKNDFHEIFKQMMVGNFIDAHRGILQGHQRCLVLNYSAASRRFLHYCSIMMACGRGRPGTPARGIGAGRQRNGTVYYRGEMQEWNLQDSEVEHYRCVWVEADGATARQHFGAVLVTE